MYTGYARFWPDRVRYMGTAAGARRRWQSCIFLGFPGSGRFLLMERGIVSVGLDTPSIDYGQSTDFAVHRYLYENNVLGFENVTNLDQLPHGVVLSLLCP